MSDPADKRAFNVFDVGNVLSVTFEYSDGKTESKISEVISKTVNGNATGLEFKGSPYSIKWNERDGVWGIKSCYVIKVRKVTRNT